MSSPESPPTTRTLRGFEITVHNPVERLLVHGRREGVRAVEHLGEPRRDARGVAAGQSAARADQRGEILAIHVFHLDEELPVLQADVVDVRHAGFDRMETTLQLGAPLLGPHELVGGQPHRLQRDDAAVGLRVAR